MNYERIGDHVSGLGLLVGHGLKRNNGSVLEVDNFVLCAGQEPLRNAGMKAYLIGGADEASKLDAKRAIDQAIRLAAAL